MTDHRVDLEPGHAKSIRRKPRQGSTWVNDGILYVEAGDTVTVPALDVEPPPDPDPPPTTADNILGIVNRDVVKNHARVKSLAAKSAHLDYANNGDATGHAILLAKAFVGDKAGVLAMIRGAANRDLSVHSLRAARNLIAYAAALNYLGAHEEDTWLKDARDHAYTADGGFGSIVYPGGGAAKGNNHGSAADQSVTAVDLHLGDRAHLEAKVLPVHRTRYMEPGMTVDGKLVVLKGPSDADYLNGRLVVVGPSGYMADGHDADGMLMEEQRRDGFPPPNNGNYTWGASGQFLIEAWMLKVAGYPVHSWAQDGVRRIFASRQQYGFAPSGDDGWQGHLVERLLGIRYIPLAVADGKSIGLTDAWVPAT